jgi:hypothetical protein
LPHKNGPSPQKLPPPAYIVTIFYETTAVGEKHTPSPEISRLVPESSWRRSTTASEDARLKHQVNHLAFRHRRDGSNQMLGTVLFPQSE